MMKKLMLLLFSMFLTTVVRAQSTPSQIESYTYDVSDEVMFSKKIISKGDIMVMIDQRMDAYMVSKSTGSEEADKVLSDLTKMLEKGTSSTDEFLGLMEVLERNYIKRISRESKKVIDPKMMMRDPDGYVRAVMKPLQNRTTLSLLHIIMIGRIVPEMEKVFKVQPLDNVMRLIDLGKKTPAQERLPR